MNPRKKVSQTTPNDQAGAGDDVVTALQEQALRRPGAAAVTELQVDGSRSVSYGELHGLVSVAMRMLVASHGESGFVPIFMQRSIAGIATAIAASCLGKRFVFLNPRLRLPQIRSSLQRLGNPTLVADGASLAALRPAALPPELLAELRLLLLHLDPLPRSHDKLATMLATRCLSFAAEDLGTVQTAKEPTAGHADAGGCCLFTSGSTGESKGVLIAADDMMGRAREEVAAFELTADDRILNLLPFSFDVGLNQIYSSIIAGAELVLGPSWLPRDIHNAIADLDVTGVSGVPTIWGDYMAGGFGLGRSAKHRRLRYITVSGGSLSPEKYQNLREAAPGVAVIKTYGQTEAFRTTALLPIHPESKRHSVGAAFGNVRTVIVDEQLVPCAPGTVGEVIHAGLGTMEGYLAGPSPEKIVDLRAAVDAPEMARAVRTGDLGYLDRDGFLHLKGRRDAMIKLHGNRVYPEEVAAMIQTLDGVHEAVVLAIRENSNFEEPVLVAFVAMGGSAPGDPAGFHRQLAGLLPGFMIPAKVRFMPALPRTISGKTDKQTLLAMCQEDAA
jgi:acyl-CoA synthetase (AMP-forming)/AMP-acid ligase II